MSRRGRKRSEGLGGSSPWPISPWTSLSVVPEGSGGAGSWGLGGNGTGAGGRGSRGLGSDRARRRRRRRLGARRDRGEHAHHEQREESATPGCHGDILVSGRPKSLGRRPRA